MSNPTPRSGHDNESRLTPAAIAVRRGYERAVRMGREATENAYTATLRVTLKAPNKREARKAVAHPGTLVMAQRTGWEIVELEEGA